MRTNLDSMFGIHERALQLRSERAEVLANNLANHETPNFLARDIDVSGNLKSNAQINAKQLSKTNSKHLSFHSQFSTELKYRQAVNPSADGNSVDVHIEKAKFTENAMQYMTTLKFLDHRVKTLMLAIKGE